MSFWNLDPDEWFRRFFGGGSGRTGITPLGKGGWFGDIPRQFDEMRREMERMFEEQFKDIESKAPKELIREYQTPEKML